MQKHLPVLAVVAAVLVALLLVVPPSAAPVLKILAFLASAGVAALSFSSKGPVTETPAAQPASEPSKPAQIQTKGSAEAEVVTFLGMLQDKGRFVDFLMEDVADADDAQLGAVARVVHQGCKAVLDEHLKVEPIESAEEGGPVTLTEGYAAQNYRLSGNLSGSAPFSGSLVHKGWKVRSIKLPKVIETAKDSLPPLAPAQVEIK